MLVKEIMQDRNQLNKTDPKNMNRFNMFQTAVNNSISQTIVFSVGASVRNHPVHKGALTALAGGAIVGAIVGIIGQALGVKKKNSTFTLMLCGFILEYACLFTTMPLGEKVVPFDKNLSLVTKIEDQLIGAAIFTSPAGLVLLISL